jgi:hypothetical protein
MNPKKRARKKDLQRESNLSIDCDETVCEKEAECGK